MGAPLAGSCSGCIGRPASLHYTPVDSTPHVACACRLDLLALQCKAWMGRVAAVIYAPFRDGRMVSGDARLQGRTLLDLHRVLSSFFDGLDPMSARRAP